MLGNRKWRTVRARSKAKTRKMRQRGERKRAIHRTIIKICETAKFKKINK